MPLQFEDITQTFRVSLPAADSEEDYEGQICDMRMQLMVDALLRFVNAMCGADPATLSEDRAMRFLLAWRLLESFKIDTISNMLKERYDMLKERYENNGT